MNRGAWKNPRLDDPFIEIEAECLDDAGQMDPERVKMALRLAYRRGFVAASDIYRGSFPKDLECPVPYPHFPSRESERQAARAAVEEMLKQPPKGGRKAS